MTTVLPWQYPTSVVVLDDNQYFLDSIGYILPPGYRFIFAADPRRVIRLANDSKKLWHKSLNLDSIDGSSSIGEIKTRELVADPKRSHEISTIIVDYHMPAMSGLELCEILKNHPFQKILLTASSDEGIAIKAFNKGLIQGYICKQDPNVEKHLSEALSNSTTNYFGNKFINTFSLDERKNAPFLKKEIQNFLKNYIVTNDVIEHYMIDNNGSSICVRNDGMASRIAIKTKEELQIPLTWVVSENLPLKRINEIKSCQKMFYVSINELHSLPINAWNNLLVNASQLNEQSNFYTAVVENESLPYASADLFPFYIPDF